MGDRKEPTPPPSAWRVPGDEHSRGATDSPMNQLKPDPPPAPPQKAPQAPAAQKK